MKLSVLSFLIGCMSFNSFSQLLQRDSIYHSNDSTFEIKTWKEQNIVREFIRLEGKEEFYYKEFAFKTGQLKAEGLLKNGYCSGTWTFYKKNGKPDREVNFETRQTVSYTKPAEPYDAVLKHIKQNCDSLLAQKKPVNSNFFFHFHASQSYYYRAFFPKEMSFTNVKPDAYLMRYDLVFSDDQLFRTFAYVELELDSAGLIKKENYSSMMTGYKNTDFISMRTAASIAMKNGLSKVDEPFAFEFHLATGTSKKTKPTLRIAGHPYHTKEEMDEGWHVTTFYFRYVDLDPWTGNILGAGDTTSIERKLP